MNKKDNILENRFEAESAQGFNLVHGSENYFKTIKSPFNSTAKSSSISHWGFVSLEITIAITLLLTAKIIDISTDSSEFTFNSATVQPVNKQEKLVEENFILEPISTTTDIISTKKHKQESILPSSFSNAIVNDTSSTLFTLNENGLIQKIDTVIKTEATPLFLYKDYKAKYELRYIEDLLVIDYSDTLFTGIKLNPVLSGVPALYENKEKIIANNSNTVPPNTFVKRNDYLERLAKPLKLVVKNKYEKALKEFKLLLNENEYDQNALFYGGLAYFNLADYSNSLVCFEKLKQLNNPVFEEDADWLLVKVYESLGMKDSSVKLLKTIANSNSFYRSQAIEAMKR